MSKRCTCTVAPHNFCAEHGAPMPVAATKPLYAAIEDAIWRSLDSEQAMPHSGVDPTFVVREFLLLLDQSGYYVTPTPCAGCGESYEHSVGQFAPLCPDCRRPHWLT